MVGKGFHLSEPSNALSFSNPCIPNHHHVVNPVCEKASKLCICFRERVGECVADWAKKLEWLPGRHTTTRTITLTFYTSHTYITAVEK